MFFPSAFLFAVAFLLMAISADAKTGGETPVRNVGRPDRNGELLVKNEEDLKKKLVEAGDKLIVIDFYASGCRLCQKIHPQLDHMAKVTPKVVFLKVDVEKNRNIAKKYNVNRRLPTFVFEKEGKVKAAFAGTNMYYVRATIKKYA